MANEEYLSIADFAEAVGVSKQAVYKRLKKDLVPYTKVIGGINCIEITACELFNRSTDDLNPPTKPPESHSRDNYNYLLLQIAEKDKLIEAQQGTIAGQTAQIETLQAHIMEQSKRTTELLEKQTKLQENYQILIAQQQKQLETMKKQEETDTVSTVETVVKPVEQPVEQPGENQKELSKKHNKWHSIFGGLFKGKT